MPGSASKANAPMCGCDRCIKGMNLQKTHACYAGGTAGDAKWIKEATRLLECSIRQMPSPIRQMPNVEDLDECKPTASHMSQGTDTTKSPGNAHAH